MMDSYNQQQLNHCLRNGQQSRTLGPVGEWVLHYILLAKMYVLDSAIVKTQTLFSLHRGVLTIVMHALLKGNNQIYFLYLF